MDFIFPNPLSIVSDKLNYGLIYVREDGCIGEITSLAKKMVGIITPNGNGHPAGKITNGDIVIIADNDIGNDDGLCVEDLERINICDSNIKTGQTILAMGVYGNKDIEPVYKYYGGFVPHKVIELEKKFLGLNISVSIDFENKFMKAIVNGEEHSMDYLESIGFMAVIDGVSGEVKFFQEKGYGYRGEEIGELLRGKPYQAKNSIDVETKKDSLLNIKIEAAVRGQKFIQDIKALLNMENDASKEGVYEVYKRILYCKLVRVKLGGLQDGVYVLIKDKERALKTVNFDRKIEEEVEKRERRRKMPKCDDDSGLIKGFIGSDSEIESVKHLAYKASQTKFNVLLTGESGTGKSRLARTIHDNMNPKAPFVEVTCNSISPSLLESELFGYAPGAFTGADPKGRAGYFEEAIGGTIFLDEIGELPLDIQIKLLNVIQCKQIRRVGSTNVINVDLRIITATNRDLEQMVKEGTFRQDLYYRINVFPIHVPPLRERKRDLYILANSILKDLCKKYSMEPKQFAEEAIRLIMGYDWPGNVRELENVIERAIIVCDSKLIYSEHLLIHGQSKKNLTLKEQIERAEKKILEETLFRNHDDKKKTMEELGLSKSAFYDKMHRYSNIQ
jgi:Nif-specific regulatory protein